MKESKTAIIVGCGIGGITTAAFLASEGYKVKVFEKNAYPGGRCSAVVKNGYRFDYGATMLMMPDIFYQTFNKLGEKLEDHLKLKRMDPIYNINFEDSLEFTFTPDLYEMRKQIEQVEPGSFNKFTSLMNTGFYIYDYAMENVLDRNYYNAWDYINPAKIPMLFKLKALHKHFGFIGKYFKNEQLKIVLSFQNIYVGQSPFEAPAVFTILPFMEIAQGVFFPEGGMASVSNALLKLASERGVEFIYNQSVEKIQVNGKNVTGIQLQDGHVEKADVIIANADLPYVYDKLLPDSSQNKALKKKNYACSALVFHWGVKKIYPQLKQHNVFFCKDYRRNIDQIFKHKILPDNPSFYLHSPSRNDPSAAPEGHDAMSVIVPIAHITDMHSNSSLSDAEIASVKKAVLDRLKKAGLSDLEENIESEMIATPNNWLEDLNLSKGSVFGSLGHTFFQMGYFRPHNKHSKYRNLYFVGSGTHPGNGVPLVLLSAKLVTERIIKDAGKNN